MNVFHKVTLASLKKNKTRTIVTIIGIILSAAMICAVTTSLSSLMRFLLENYIYTDGSWHGAVLNTNESTLDVLSSDEIDNYVYNSNIGYAEIGSVLDDKPYLYVIGAGDGFFDVMPVHLTSGDYPKNASEIILPEHLSDIGGVKYDIGQVLELDIGYREVGEDGIPLTQSTYFINAEDVSEVLNIKEHRSYTVVGTYSRPAFEDYEAPGFTAITLYDDTERQGMDFYYTLKQPKKIYTFIEENGLPTHVNSDVLMFMGISQYAGFNRMLYSIGGIFISLIMFGSIFLIYNAFSISVSERTKQFGLLSSIGATRKQLSKMVFFEAFVVSLIGIPLGILSGIGGIAVTLRLIGDKFSEVFVTSSHIPMRLHVSLTSVIIAAVVALLTVLISAYVPSHRATRITAVEAIRQSHDIKTTKKRVKTSRLTYKLFGLPGVLAKKHFKRNKKKYRTTVLSLFLSIVLFVPSFYMSQMLISTVSEVYASYGFDICCSFYESIDTTKQIASAVRALPEVERSAYAQREVYSLNAKKNDLGEQWIEMYAPMTSGDTINVEGCIYFLEDEEFSRFLEENKIDKTAYFSQTPCGVAIDGQSRFSTTDEKFVTVNALREKSCVLTTDCLIVPDGYSHYEDYITEDGVEMTRFVKNGTNGEVFLEMKSEDAWARCELNIGTTLYEEPFFVDYSGDISLIYPLSALSKVFPEGSYKSVYRIMLTTSNHKKTEQDMRAILAEHNIDTEVTNYAEDAQRSRDMVLIIQVFSYGFIVLISLISAANVFNTISTNIILRRCELAVLKSVGMSSSDFNKMMNYECLLYGTKALLYGLPVACVLSYLIYLSFNEGVTATFTLPYTAILISTLCVFAVVFATMLYAMRKIKKDNPIIALKNENI